MQAGRVLRPAQRRRRPGRRGRGAVGGRRHRADPVHRRSAPADQQAGAAGIRSGNRELAALVPPLAAAEAAAIQRGQLLFDQIHVQPVPPPVVPRGRPDLPGAVGRRPTTATACSRAAGCPSSSGLDVRVPVTFDITNDQPDNKFDVGVGAEPDPPRQLPSGRDRTRSSSPTPTCGGTTWVTGWPSRSTRWGPASPSSSPPPLWGVGSSAPYLHDGRAVTLTEAILWHRGEGEIVPHRLPAAARPTRRRWWRSSTTSSSSSPRRRRFPRKRNRRRTAPGLAGPRLPGNPAISATGSQPDRPL